MFNFKYIFRIHKFANKPAYIYFFFIRFYFFYLFFHELLLFHYLIFIFIYIYFFQFLIIYLYIFSFLDQGGPYIHKNFHTDQLLHREIFTQKNLNNKKKHIKIFIKKRIYIDFIYIYKLNKKIYWKKIFNK